MTPAKRPPPTPRPPTPLRPEKEIPYPSSTTTSDSRQDRAALRTMLLVFNSAVRCKCRKLNALAAVLRSEARSYIRLWCDDRPGTSRKATSYSYCDCGPCGVGVGSGAGSDGRRERGLAGLSEPGNGLPWRIRLRSRRASKARKSCAR